MNKLIIIACVALGAACANAATFSWSVGQISASPDNEAKAGMVAYFMAASTYDTFAALSADKVAEFVTGNYLYTANTTSARGAIQVNSTGNGSYSAGDSQSGYVVLFDTSTAATSPYYAATSVQTSSEVPDTGANISIGFGNFATATSGWQTTAVPEPTSGLLMLLGMAGLALRRRRA